MLSAIKNHRIKILLGVLIVTALGASYSVGSRWAGQVAVPMHMTDIQVCQRMDINRDGTITSRDWGIASAYAANALIEKDCSILTGDEADRCRAVDVDMSGIVTAEEAFAVRMYGISPSTLKECPPVPLDPFDQCLQMDVNGDGVITNKDAGLATIYANDTNTKKACWNLTGEDFKTCAKMDTDRSLIVDGHDSLWVRMHLGSVLTLKECKVEPECDASSTDLTQEMMHSINTRIESASAWDMNYTKLFSKRGNATLPWTRNPIVWTAQGETPLDFTGVSPWNSRLGYKMAGTLISPRHIVFAQHYQINPGSKIIFIDKNSSVVTRTVGNQKQIGETDIRIAVLDSDVPSTIAHYPIIPEDVLKSRLAPFEHGTFFTEIVPIAVLNQRDEVLLREVWHLSNKHLYHSQPTLGRRDLLHMDTFQGIIDEGDSGDAGFFVINGKLALAITNQGKSYGPYYGSFIDEINQAMTELGGGYQITQFDLSCFTPRS